MATIVESLGKELSLLDKQYSEEFAGQSRLTRDISLLDRMIERCSAVVAQIDQIPAPARGPDLAKLRETASQNLGLYAEERKAIVRAQEVGPTFEAFSLEATAANLVFARYARHFAGKDRSTRDLALLGELVEELKQIDKRMSQLLGEASTKSSELERDRTVVRESLAQYQKEIGLIEEAQSSGTPDQRGSVLATLANNQFAVYQTHFAGEPRISRRPALLVRVVSSLKKIHERMVALADEGLDFNTKNMGIVEERLKIYESELAEIRKLRQSTAMPDIMGELGGAANKLFEEYRSAFADKPRAQVDLERLGNVCDKLAEVRRQMSEMAWAEDNDMNSKNFEIVNEQLVMFESEYEAVTQAKRNS